LRALLLDSSQEKIETTQKDAAGLPISNRGIFGLNPFPLKDLGGIFPDLFENRDLATWGVGIQQRRRGGHYHCRRGTSAANAANEV
jgi:hypothetical protein